MLNKLKKTSFLSGHTIGRPGTPFQTEKFSHRINIRGNGEGTSIPGHARQILWWLLRYLLHSKPIYKGGGRWPLPQKRSRGLRPRNLFWGFLCIGLEQCEYRSSHHNTCLACRCDWTVCSSPLGLYVPSPFRQWALARTRVWGPLSHRHGGWRCLRPPQGSREVWGGAWPPIISTVRFVSTFRDF